MSHESKLRLYTEWVHACHDAGMWSVLSEAYARQPLMMSELPGVVEELKVLEVEAKRRAHSLLRQFVGLGTVPVELRDEFARSLIPAPPALEDTPFPDTSDDPVPA